MASQEKTDLIKILTKARDDLEKSYQDQIEEAQKVNDVEKVNALTTLRAWEYQSRDNQIIALRSPTSEKPK